MNKEKDFLKTCFNIVAGLEVKNKSQAIAKGVVLDEIEYLQQENKFLNYRMDLENHYRIRYHKLKDNWNKLKEQIINRFNESQDVQFLDVLQDMQELEGSDSNE